MPSHSLPFISPFDAVILGLIQGLTEFLPVSSSAHLNIAHWLLGQNRRELVFDVMLHLGTLVALAWYFEHDWKNLLFDPAQRKLRNMVLIGCIPAAVIGLPLHGIEDLPFFADVRHNAIALAIMGVVLWISDFVGKKSRDIDHIGLPQSLAVGFSQALALIPGVSRSGSTITAGLFLGLKREDAARFSFLMSLPITLGAVLFEFVGAFKHHGPGGFGASLGTLALGIVVSGLSGFWAIGFLLNFLKRHDVAIFAAWRILVALAIFALIASGHHP
jgi:undecaprenyl-diphosphatase